MSSINNSVRSVTRIGKNSVEQTLQRLTLAHMLWEDQFYVDGQSSADTISALIPKADPSFVANLAFAARKQYKLRHVPLLIMRELARNGKMKAEDLAAVIQRPDEMGEFLSIYWKDKRTAVSNQVKKGLAKAFVKFNEYSLAKWDKNSANISIRDVMFIAHPKPQTPEQEALFKRVADQKLATPETWETELSAGANKKATFERLMAENKLGALAFLRNLRNMRDSGVSTSAIAAYAEKVNTDRVLPFRFLAAARIVPEFSGMLERMMLASLSSHEKLPGKTVLLIDVSGSMFGTKVSAKSDLDRFDAAAALAVLAREICEDVEIYSFSDIAVRIGKSYRGMALVKALSDSQRHNGTNTGHAVRAVNAQHPDATRCIMFTDEQPNQSYTSVPNPVGTGYIVNVAAYKQGIENGSWHIVTGFSEAVIDYIQALEA